VTPRITPAPATGNRPDIQELLEAAEQAVGGAVNVNRTIARHPGLFRRFAGFTGKLLHAGTLPPRDRELMIMRTAWLCGSTYEWGQHHRISLGVGLRADELDHVPDIDHESWNAHDRTLLRAVDELVHAKQISKATWDLLAVTYDERQLIELLMVIGAYVMIAGFLNSVEVEPEPGVVGFPVTESDAR
jgi:alkylhydroperoxidase family enzyme